jgi:hypothetical protein
MILDPHGEEIYSPAFGYPLAAFAETRVSAWQPARRPVQPYARGRARMSVDQIISAIKRSLARREAGLALDGRRSAGFTARAEMNALWDMMRPDEQDEILIAAKAILSHGDDPAFAPLIRTGKR